MIPTETPKPHTHPQPRPGARFAAAELCPQQGGPSCSTTHPLQKPVGGSSDSWEGLFSLEGTIKEFILCGKVRGLDARMRGRSTPKLRSEDRGPAPQKMWQLQTQLGTGEKRRGKNEGNFRGFPLKMQLKEMLIIHFPQLNQWAGFGP